MINGMGTPIKRKPPKLLILDVGCAPLRFVNSSNHKCAVRATNFRHVSHLMCLCSHELCAFNLQLTMYF